jgi:hypothetical protein
MAGVVVVVTIALFLGGIPVGVIAAAAVSLRREDLPLQPGRRRA